ncbi:MAG TPA: tryptophanase [Planctomycetaceae bacterium]|jgi:tryptophanase
MKTIIEPFRIKVIEPLQMRTREEREAIIRRAGFNMFLIPAADVLIDLLTDSGTGAMSSLQWAGVMQADESYAGSPSFFHFERVLQDITGFQHILPTHQGRASERILFELIGGKEKVVPSNAHFDTTRANIEHSGAEAVDLPIEEARHPRQRHPFKGNLDVAALQSLIERVGSVNVPVVMCTVTSNSFGGQPASLENLHAIRKVCDRYHVPLFLDACRFAENAWFIKQRETGQHDRPVRAIVKEMFDLTDGATISAKKDGLVNTGGLLLLRDEALFQRASNLLILTEGYVTYGGLAGRDLEAMAQGFQEVLEEDYLCYRIRSAEYVGEKLLSAGVQIIEPPGGHAIYIDAAAFCPRIPPDQFPGQALAVALYRHAGIRGVEIGSVMFGGAGHEPPPMELLRLAFPRRVYTQSHIDYVIEAIVEVFARRDEIRGLRIVAEPPALRHFTARFEEV